VSAASYSPRTSCLEGADELAQQVDHANFYLHGKVERFAVYNLLLAPSSTRGKGPGEAEGWPAARPSELGLGERIAASRPLVSYNELGSLLDTGPASSTTPAAVLGPRE
jgi:hypothetical protein